MKLEWHSCPCGHTTCRLAYPINLGQYYQGTGFTPEERALMDEAFAALAEKKEAARSRTTQEFMTTSGVQLALNLKEE